MFRVGDVCEIVGYRRCPELLGAECVIIGPEEFRKIAAFRGPSKVTFAFRVRLSIEHPSGGNVCVQQRENLRLKRPPSWNRWLFDITPVRDELNDAIARPVREGVE